MDEIYGILVTVDFPEAVTGGLRHSTDAMRGVLERTPGRSHHIVAAKTAGTQTIRPGTVRNPADPLPALPAFSPPAGATWPCCRGPLPTSCWNPCFPTAWKSTVGAAAATSASSGCGSTTSVFSGYPPCPGGTKRSTSASMSGVPPSADDRGPGVVFIRQLVPHRVTTWVARLAYREPFSAVSMCHRFSGPEAVSWPGKRRVAYGWQSVGRQHSFWLESDAEPVYARPGSLEEFLTARHWGYNGKPGGRTLAYTLTRPPWLILPAGPVGASTAMPSRCTALSLAA